MRALCEFLCALLYAFASLREKNNRKDKADSNKCAKAFCLLPTACCLLFLTTANAQVYPVQGTAALIPPYALRLSDYTTSATDRFVLNALLADVTKAELHVRFRISIVGQNVKLETKPEYIGSPITLQGGIPLRLTNVELAEYFDPNHLNFSGISKNDFLKTGFLPEGFYQFCFEVYEYNRGVKISNTICAPAWLILNDPPLINLPLSGSKLKPLSPQNVIFQWTPRHMGSPNAAFSTEYDVKVVEVWPANRNPNDAILTQPPIYETTTNSTTLIYGPDATQLEPGRVYAFRVQARAMAGAEQLDLFKNNGYSETVTFIYGDACDAPINVVAEASTPTRISLQWDASPSQTGYTVQYRPSSPSPLERGPGGEAWYSSTSLIPSLEISGLQPNTAYEYQLMSTCGSFESSFGNIATITTPDMAQKGYTCGLAPENFNLDPSQLIPVLKVGEVINAGDFDVTLTKVTGASGTFSGEGAVVVPFLNQVRGRVKFDNITVNNDKRMVKGYMNVTGGGIEIVPAGVMNAMEQLSQVLSIADSALNLARQFVTPPPDPATFVADTLIVVAGGINKVYKDVATGNIIVVDNSGKSQSLPPGKNLALTDSSGKGVLVDKKGGVGNTTAAQATATAKREYNFSVTFAKASNTNYGFDEQKIDALKSNYEKLGSSYFVTWKAVSQLTSDPVVATFSGKDISADKIKFEQDGTTVSSTATGNSFNLSAGPVAAGVTSALTAKASVGDKEQILGKLNLVGYNSKPMKLKIVLVNDVKFSTNATTIKTQLDKIYSQSVVSWDVEISSSNLKVSSVANPFDDGSSGLLSNYTGDMKSVINTYGDLQSDTYYLFLIDKPASGTKQGYMPRSKQAGFIFTEPHGNDATKIINTMAHELGHGAFTLKHTFADYTSLTQGSTDNLMDYNNGTLLWKYQWDKIHDPAVVLGLFESDEAGASKLSVDLTGLTASVNEKAIEADKIFVITEQNFKLNVKYNKENGGEVKFRLAIKPEGGGTEILYPSDDSKKVQNDEQWVLEINPFQEGKYTLTYLVGDKTTKVDFYVRKEAYDYACQVCGRNLKLSQEDLDKIFPNSEMIKDDTNILTYFNETLKKGDFTTCYRQAHFFSQIYEESGGMNASVEGSHYSVKQMLITYKGNTNAKDIFFKQTFWSNKTYLDYASVGLYETSTENITKFEGKDYTTYKWNKTTTSDTVRIPTSFSQKQGGEYKKVNLTEDEQETRGKKLHNLVYKDINGNINDDDGYKFHGRGAIQLTGRDTYKGSSDKCNFLFGTSYDWVNNSVPLENDNKAIVYSVSGFFLWKLEKKGKTMNALDTDNVKDVTLIVNGGTNGLANRQSKFNLYITGRLNNCKIKK